MSLFHGWIVFCNDVNSLNQKMRSKFNKIAQSLHEKIHFFDLSKIRLYVSQLFTKQLSTLFFSKAFPIYLESTYQISAHLVKF